MGADYVGPAAANDDIQAFRNEFWTNIRGADRRGGCHNATGQSPSFARSDDVNQAYQQATGVINRENPSLSLLVTKVAGGHNCWRGDPSACASDLTRWITAWVGADRHWRQADQRCSSRAGRCGGGKALHSEHTASRVRRRLQPARRASAPAAISPTPQRRSRHSSRRAIVTPTLPTMQRRICRPSQAAIPKIEFESLRNSHASWCAWARKSTTAGPPDCTADAPIMLDRDSSAWLTTWTAPVPPPGTLSKALTLYDGTVASGGNRYEANMIALYEFKTGSGNIAYDTSGVAPRGRSRSLGPWRRVGRRLGYQHQVAVAPRPSVRRAASSTT